MHLRWLLFDYADPELPISFWQRMRLSFKPYGIHRLPRDCRWARITYSLVTIGPFVAWQFTPFSPARLVMAGYSFWQTLVIMLTAMWPWMAFWYGILCRSEHYVRIRQAGYRICTHCGYWLRGLPDDIAACPDAATPRSEAH